MKLRTLIIFLTLSVILNADYVLKYDMDGQQTELLYKNSKTSKLISNSQDGKVEVYNLDKNSYLVSHTNDGITVVDTNKLKNKLSEFGISMDMFKQEQEKPTYDIKQTNKKVKVGNIYGKEWIISGIEDGQRYNEKVVVSNDKNLVTTLRTMFKATSKMTGGAMGEDNPFEVKKGYVIIKADGMKLISFNKQNISAKEYAIPKVTNNRESFNKRVQSNQSTYNNNRNNKPKKDVRSCYNNVCCGEVAGESVVLLNSQYRKSRNIFKIVDSATCKTNSKNQRVEEVIWEDDYGKRIHLTLNLNDQYKGTIKKAMDNGALHNNSLEGSTILKSEHILINAHYKGYYALFKETNQERMEIFISDNATLTITRINDKSWQRSLQGWAEKGWIQYKTLKRNAENLNHNAPIPPKQQRAKLSKNVENNPQNNNSNNENKDSDSPLNNIMDNIKTEDLNKAVDMFKSLF